MDYIEIAVASLAGFVSGYGALSAQRRVAQSRRRAAKRAKVAEARQKRRSLDTGAAVECQSPPDPATTPGAFMPGMLWTCPCGALYRLKESSGVLYWEPVE